MCWSRVKSLRLRILLLHKLTILNRVVRHDLCFCPIFVLSFFAHTLPCLQESHDLGFDAKQSVVNCLKQDETEILQFTKLEIVYPFHFIKEIGFSVRLTR